MNAKLQFVLLLLTVALVPSEQVKINDKSNGVWVLKTCKGLKFQNFKEYPNYLLRIRSDFGIDPPYNFMELIGNGILAGKIQKGYSNCNDVDKVATGPDSEYYKFRKDYCGKIQELEVTHDDKLEVKYNDDHKCTYVRFRR